MKCRACQAEIADKAIVCYRCGTPTADLPEVPRARARVPERRAGPTRPVFLLVLAAIVGLASVALAMIPGESPVRWAVWVAVAGAVVLLFWLGARPRGHRVH